MGRIFLRRGSDISSEEVLTHYAAVLQGHREPMFQAARKAGLDILLGESPGVLEDMDTEELQDLHDRCQDAFMGLYRSGEAAALPGTGHAPSFLDLKIELARRLESPCVICENLCRARRAEGSSGRCGVVEPRVASEFVHMGEEEELIPSHTVFFSGCNLECIYCQNWDISQNPERGIYVPPGELASIIDRGYDDAGGRIRNVNWVGGDPTPSLSYILQVMKHLGSPLPQVWNSNMYLTREAVVLLFGVIDLYLPDFKYGCDRCGEELSGVSRYFDTVRRNIELASRRGDMIVRHLVLPGHLDCCTIPVMDALADMGTPNIKVNIMDQYRPEYHWREREELGRRITASEYDRALAYAREKGLALVRAL